MSALSRLARGRLPQHLVRRDGAAAGFGAGLPAQHLEAVSHRAPEIRTPDGEVGVVTILDLANTGSVLAIQSADLGRAVGDGFEVLGREAGAEARGCSIAADEMLQGPNSSLPRESGRFS